MSILSTTRMLTANRAMRFALLLAVYGSLIGVLVCWQGTSKPAWAQGDSTAPSLGFRIEQLEAEVKKAGEPTTQVIVRNGNDGDNDLEFDAVLQGDGTLQAEDAPSLSLLGDPMKLGVDPGKTTVDAKVFIRNDSALSADDLSKVLEFSAELRNSEEEVIEPINVAVETSEASSKAQINPYMVKPVNLNITLNKPIEDYAAPLAGYLVVSSKEKKAVAPGSLALTLSEAKADAPEWYAPQEWPTPFDRVALTAYNAIIVVPFLISFLVVFLRYVIICKSIRTLSVLGGLRVPLGTRVGLDFDKSWVSILTVVAGLFAGVQGAEIFPEIRWWFSKDEIAGLSLYFALMLTLAPVIYNIFVSRSPQEFNPGAQESQRTIGTFKLRRGQGQDAAEQSDPGGPQDYEGDFEIEQSPEDGENTKPQGFVSTFLIASSLVLGAVFGQLIVGLILIWQIDTDMSLLARLVLALAALFAIVTIFHFAWQQIPKIFTRKADPNKRDPERLVLP